MNRNEVKLNMSEVKDYIANSSENTEVYVGCDSNRFRRYNKETKRKEWFAAYARVIVVHIDGEHGCKVFGDVVTHPDYGNLKQRLMQEVYFASEIGYELVDVIGDRPLQIHLDLNVDPCHKSNVAVKEATGYIQGMFGFKPHLKPNAPAATCAADKLAA